MDGLKVTRITGVSSAFNWLLKIVANRVARHFQGRIEAALQDERPREPQSHQTSRHPHPVSLFRRSLMSGAHQLTLHSQAPGPVYLWQIAYKPWLHKVDRSRFPALSGNGSRISGESFAYPSAPF
ncbi:hypothetical protein HPB52_018746 [Rhipicephalus sanguineus]|uniref:Uncharacterized protein n=1 Tax=Rhipicephalus sanguineus TaxID=34632 RepID=A0A9D4TB76_RHISA|nr:hypothetical protein HPB52_018746 [Rhipicephalus sanguineus]